MSQHSPGYPKTHYVDILALNLPLPPQKVIPDNLGILSWAVTVNLWNHLTSDKVNYLDCRRWG